jgi:hypothetical protein
MKAQTKRKGDGSNEAGFALILAILALMLLTFMGLTLATMTSTELQIATNYRWSQQALYNAEAGIEYGKSLLRNMNWSLILPAPREGAPPAGTVCTNNTVSTFMCWRPTDTFVPAIPLEPPPYARADPHGNPTRNFENSTCDKYGAGMGYGVVLDDGGANPAPYQNVTTAGAGVPALNGSFTLWVRRAVKFNSDGSYSDAEAGTDTTLVLTSEGTAPFTGEVSNLAMTQTNRAIRILEATVSRTLSTPCGTRGGQVGGGPEGSNFSPCDPITGDSLNGVLGGGPGRRELANQQ